MPRTGGLVASELGKGAGVILVAQGSCTLMG